MILVTGGCGFIGGQTAIRLLDAGFDTLVLDNLSRSETAPIERPGIRVVQGDVLDQGLLDYLFKQYPINAVVHCAGHARVGESFDEPALYYENNAAGTLVLLKAMARAGIKRFVFSSSCAVYGNPVALPIVEGHPLDPISPYGRSKLAAEQIIADCASRWEIATVVFRYFNVAGADRLCRFGEPAASPRLIARALAVAAGDQAKLKVFGDGGIIREYVHVDDVARAHLEAVRYLVLDGPSLAVMNLGGGAVASIDGVVQAVSMVTEREVPVEVVERRPGDPPILYCDAGRARSTLGWTPSYDLYDIVAHAWAWKTGAKA